jgi:hypothetical protein
MMSMPIFLLFLMTLEIGDALLQLPAPLAAVILETSKRKDTADTSESTGNSQEDDLVIALLLVEITIECRHCRAASIGGAVGVRCRLHVQGDRCSQERGCCVRARKRESAPTGGLQV